ncbi:MAG: tetratricopeptide repeat protein [Ignavibacteriae bacterium]|nr:tetratricopeptide repeat protein [Ignavibacteriota bacterium]
MSHSTGTQRISTQFFLVAAACFVIVAAQAIVYGPSLSHPFIAYDDNTYVYENRNIHSLSWQSVENLFSRSYFHSYTPLALLSHAMDFAIWQTNAFGHHLTSMLLHCANAILFFVACLKLLSKVHSVEPENNVTGQFTNAPTRTIIASFAATLLYSIHPLRVESVAWISDRKDLLMTFFLLVSTLFYVRHVERKSDEVSLRWYLLSVGCFLLALLSKSVAVVLPLLFFVLDWILLRSPGDQLGRRRLLIEKLPFLFLSLIFALIALGAAPKTKLNIIVAQMSSIERTLLPLYSLTFYLAKTLWPQSITPIYDAPGFWLIVVGGSISILISVCTVVLALQGQRGWLASWLSYAILLAPTFALSSGIQPWADRYAYAASIPLTIGVGGLLDFFWRKKRVSRSVLLFVPAGVAVLFGILSARQVHLWSDAETLWRHAVQVSPRVPATHENLGLALSSGGNSEAASQMFRKAIALHPTYAEALFNLGVMFERRAFIDSAEYYYAQAILADSTFADAYTNLGNIYVSRGINETGIALYNRAVTMNPSDADVYYNLGYAYYQSGDKSRAVSFFEKAIVLSPNYAKAHFNLGYVLLEMHNEERALASLIRAAQLGSEEAQKLLHANGHSW